MLRTLSYRYWYTYLGPSSHPYSRLARLDLVFGALHALADREVARVAHAHARVDLGIQEDE